MRLIHSEIVWDAIPQYQGYGGELHRQLSLYGVMFQLEGWTSSSMYITSQLFFLWRK